MSDPVYPVYVDTNVMVGNTAPADGADGYAGIVYLPCTADNDSVAAPPAEKADLSLGELTWPIIRDHVERVITADDRQVIDAMRLVWLRSKLLIEPSAAVAVAVVLSEAFKSLSGLDRVGVILSGGNVDLGHLPW